MKRCLLTAVALVAAAAFSYAQDVYDLVTQVKLQKDGSANVAQVWDLYATEGTEWYIPITNPGKSYIHDFYVSEDGQLFTSEGRSWNSGRSIEAKAHRSGIVEKGGGDIELCWGLGSLGRHKFVLSYTIDNLVQSYPEGDGFHWHFLNDEWYAAPEHASITFINESGSPEWFHERADSCNVRFWGFGMVGDSYLQDGKIVFESTEPLQYRSFFSALMLFDKGMFQPQVEGAGTFEELKSEAMKGSDYGSGKEKRSMEDWFYIIIGILVFVALPVLVVLYLIYLLLLRLYRKATGNRYNKEIFGKSKIDGWWRDVPMDGNPSALFSLIQSGDYLAKNKNTNFPNVVSAYFLKWIQEGLLKVEKDPKKEGRVNLMFVKKDEVIDFADNVEDRIYKGALEAAGDNYLLEANEFKKWSYKHDTWVASWPNEAYSWGRSLWTPLSKEERCHAIEFKNYLSDFTLVGEREAPEVGLWKKYMIIAASLGIADKVAKNFEKLFPEVMEQYARQTGMYDSMTTYYILDSLRLNSNSMMSSALNRQQQRQAAAAAQARRSGGGGGSISFGGGGGGFGGGHGGGAR